MSLFNQSTASIKNITFLSISDINLSNQSKTFSAVFFAQVVLGLKPRIACSNPA